MCDSEQGVCLSSLFYLEYGINLTYFCDLVKKLVHYYFLPTQKAYAFVVVVTVSTTWKIAPSYLSFIVNMFKKRGGYISLVINCITELLYQGENGIG